MTVIEIFDKTPLGKVVSGSGETDGVLENNVFASGLCGPLLPKNPKLTDILLKRALVKKYGEAESFPMLCDETEKEALEVMRKRLLSN